MKFAYFFHFTTIVSKELPELAGLKENKLEHHEYQSQFLVSKELPELAGLKVRKVLIDHLSFVVVSKELPELAGLKVFGVNLPRCPQIINVSKELPELAGLKVDLLCRISLLKGQVSKELPELAGLKDCVPARKKIRKIG